MGLHKGSRRALLGSAQLSVGQFLATLPGDSAIWDMNDLPPGAILRALPNSTYNGSQTGFAMGQPTGLPLGYAGELDGANDFGGLHTAALQTAWNPDLFTVGVFFKVANVGVWTDATLRMIGPQIGADANNRVFIYRTGAANTITYYFVAGGTVEQADKAALTTTDYLFAAVTVNAAGVGFSAWHNGVQVGASQAIGGVWAGALNATWCSLGSTSSAAAANVWEGSIATVFVVNEDWSEYMPEISARAGITG